jgi:5-methylcytosine-specific restriction endonuclease McrA
MAKKKYIPIADLSPEEQERRHAENQVRWQKYYAAHQETRCQRSREYQAKNKPLIRLRRQQRRATDPTVLRQQERLSRARTRQSRSTVNRQYRLSHLEAERHRIATWKQDNPDKVHANAARRRACIANAPINDFTAKEWRALCQAAGYCCAYCGKKFAFKDLTPDHLTPYAKQGSNTLHNVLPCCGSCNSRKKDRPVLKPVQPFLLLPPEDAAAD